MLDTNDIINLPYALRVKPVLRIALTLALVLAASGNSVRVYAQGEQAPTRRGPALRVPAPLGVSPASTQREQPRLSQSDSTETLRAEEVQPKLTLEESLDRKGDLILRGTNSSIENALFAISEIWKVNIVVGKDVRGTVSGTFTQAPLREILDSILSVNGYSYRAIGDSITVLPENAVGSANPLYRELSIPIYYGDLNELADAAKLLTSAQGQVRPLKSARSLLVIDYADRVETIRNFISRMENAASKLDTSPQAVGVPQLEVAYFHTQYVPADNVKSSLSTVMSPEGRIEVMSLENRVVIVDYRKNIDMVRKVLSRIDRPRPQVRITALIYDLSLEDVEKLGVNWNSGAKGNSLGADGSPNQLLELDTTTLVPLTGAGSALTVQSLTRNFDITAVMVALQNANDARLLADPNVTVMDNEVAVWKSVSEIPYQQITQSEFGGNIGTTAFKEAGITLKVQPTIAADGTVEMLIEPEFSRLAGFTPQENQPIIDTRKTSTTVRVANRQTLVLSGLRQRSDTGEFNGIPFLKDIRGIGPLFRSRDTNVRESELIVFIMPEIVGYEDPLDARQYQAAETVNCRLDKIPQAEGCPADCQGCSEGIGACEEDRLIQLPPVGTEVEPEIIEKGGTTSAAVPMRPQYEARFRANVPNSENGRRLTDGPAAPSKVEARRSFWQRMKGS
ncbi:type II secretion system protein GspD [Adhaeretor mobilis]|uniref:Type II secretion system protein D n=1 Tax=Adhaeretor mobilis TaxID=1930276 RepID=A0A517MWV7_9BACT|nr:secretin N-terminal domain-containing protein [Adhaeretor mobilis]QDS99364.1 Type II secretion system protein D precursor [Adhaeretor mobilis]